MHLSDSLCKFLTDYHSTTREIAKNKETDFAGRYVSTPPVKPFYKGSQGNTEDARLCDETQDSRDEYCNRADSTISNVSYVKQRNEQISQNF